MQLCAWLDLSELKCKIVILFTINWFLEEKSTSSLLTAVNLSDSQALSMLHCILIFQFLVSSFKLEFPEVMKQGSEVTEIHLMLLIIIHVILVFFNLKQTKNPNKNPHTAQGPFCWPLGLESMPSSGTSWEYCQYWESNQMCI